MIKTGLVTVGGKLDKELQWMRLVEKSVSDLPVAVQLGQAFRDIETMAALFPHGRARLREPGAARRDAAIREKWGVYVRVCRGYRGVLRPGSALPWPAPQVIKTLRSRPADDISIGMYLLMAIAITLVAHPRIADRLMARGSPPMR